MTLVGLHIKAINPYKKSQLKTELKAKLHCRVNKAQDRGRNLKPSVMPMVAYHF